VAEKNDGEERKLPASRKTVEGEEKSNVLDKRTKTVL